MSESKEMVIILTGASRGIGLATAHHLLTNAHNLLLISRTRAPLDALQSQYGSTRVQVLAGDMADYSLSKRAVDLALSRWGRIDAVVLNHGGLEPVRKVGESSAGEWEGCFRGNVFGGVGMIQAALPSLRTSKGRIILTSSGASVSAYQGWGAYGASKAVLNHLALTLSVEEPDVVTISIRPGVVDTEMQRQIREEHASGMSAKDQTKFAGLKTNGGLLRPEQPGHVIAKLAAARASDLSGLSGKFLNWNDESLAMHQEE